MNFFLSLLRCDLVSSLTILRSLPFDLLIISTSFTISHLFEMMVNLVFDVRWRLPCALPLQSFSKNAFMILGDRDSKIDQHLPPLIPGAYSVIPNYSFFLPMLAFKSLIIIVKWDFSLLLAKGTSQKLYFFIAWLQVGTQTNNLYVVPTVYFHHHRNHSFAYSMEVFHIIF